MIEYELRIDSGMREELWGHLLPDDDKREQAAFLLCATMLKGERRTFEAVEMDLMRGRDFRFQGIAHLELADAARVRIIKRAHALGLSLVELHSHRWAEHAAFSPSDRMGLQDTVPHMYWRLKNRPYAAVVVGPTSFDALVWWDQPQVPSALTVLDGWSPAPATDQPLPRRLGRAWIS